MVIVQSDICSVVHLLNRLFVQKIFVQLVFCSTVLFKWPSSIAFVQQSDHQWPWGKWGGDDDDGRGRPISVTPSSPLLWKFWLAWPCEVHAVSKKNSEKVVHCFTGSGNDSCTTWFGEMSSCFWLTFLPGLPGFWLTMLCKHYFWVQYKLTHLVEDEHS